MRKKGKGNYAEDSTLGKSNIDPKSYKGDAFVQVNIDSRVLAMLSDWLDSSPDSVTRHLSEVVRFTLEAVVDNLLANEIIKKIEFCTEARELLERKYKVNLNSGGRYRKNLLHNMVLDDRRRSNTMTLAQSDKRPIIEHGSSEKLDEMLDIYKKLEERDSGLVVDKEDIKERLRNSNSTKIVPDSRDSDVMSTDDESHQEQVQEQNQSVQSHQIRHLSEEELDEVERRIAEKDRLLAEKTRTIPLNIKRV